MFSDATATYSEVQQGKDIAKALYSSERLRRSGVMTGAAMAKCRYAKQRHKRAGRREEMILKFTIGIEPRTKKNSMRIVGGSGKKFLVPSKEFLEYQKSCGWFIPVPDKPIDYKVNIKATYYMKTRRRVDITNLHSALHDILVHYGVIADDNMKIVVGTDGSRVRYDKDRPRTEVEITKLEEVTGFE